ncbi:MAG: hypothetical protein QOE90_2412 [Thermoplasmata archaeon]|jgi:hypothetical protein|nr:hypothetical protein [Thermoplasmata archaeon]
MRSALVTLLLLAAGGLFPYMTGAANAADNTITEGKLAPFAAGDSLSLSLSGSSLILYFSAFDKGADLDTSHVGIAISDYNLHLHPFEVSGYQVVPSQDPTRTLAVQNGTGVLMAARNDLMTNLPLDKAPPYVELNDTLGPGACKAYLYTLDGMEKPALVRANGTGVAFALLSSNLTVQKRGGEAFNSTVDPKTEGLVFVQACASGAAPGSFTISGTYPAPSVSDETHTVPGVTVAWIVVAVVGLAWARRR